MCRLGVLTRCQRIAVLVGYFLSVERSLDCKGVEHWSPEGFRVYGSRVGSKASRAMVEV